MASIPVIAVIDVGKTNKKLLLFDAHYRVVEERSARLTETFDEDGDPCENIDSLRSAVFESLRSVKANPEWEIRAINFSAYGASFVYINERGEPVAPLYNYLKPFPDELRSRFYERYGGEENFPALAASPVLGSLNSGMQFYRLKHERPQVFQRVRYGLHLPQYLSYLLTGKPVSDITSIGCHTNLWDFNRNQYHEWVEREGIVAKLAPVVPYDAVTTVNWEGSNCVAGPGLHDSSSALIPYLVSFQEPFVLISSGTWCISLNPFNHSPLTVEELKRDCLCYLDFKGRPVKASRLFSGYIHDEQVNRIADYFHTDPIRYRNISYDRLIYDDLRSRIPDDWSGETVFADRDLAQFNSDGEAYHQLIRDLVVQQYVSTNLVLNDQTVKRIFVDGGFSKNELYMNLLAQAFAGREVYATSIAQASSLGAALAIHHAWNPNPVPSEIIELKYYSAVQFKSQN